MVSQNISEETNTNVSIACLVISTIFVILRAWARWYKNRKIPIAAEDLAMYIALSSYAIMCGLYLAAMPVLYKAMAVQAGLAPPYASLMSDLVSMLKEFFAVQIFFWLTLWAVKFSLLFMFQRLTTGLPIYERVWWGVVIFTFLSFVGCVVSQFTSCSSMHAWFAAGMCATPRDAIAKAASLWYSLAVDLITDLMIMAVPVQILYSLHISTAQKLSVGVVFTVGIITMVFAIVRVVSLDSGTTDGQVSPTWLILWAGIEGVVAIIVGCLPSFAIFIRGHVASSRRPTTASYPYTSSSSPSSSSPSTIHKSYTLSRKKAKSRSQSFSLNDIEASNPEPRQNADKGSATELVVQTSSSGADARVKDANRITITHHWTQKWHDGDKRDAENEKRTKLAV